MQVVHPLTLLLTIIAVLLASAATLPWSTIPGHPLPGSPLATAAAEGLNLQPLRASPFAEAIFQKARAPDASRSSSYRQACSDHDQQDVTKVVASLMATDVLLASNRSDSLLAEPRTDFIFYLPSARRFTDRWPSTDESRVHGLVGTMLTQYFQCAEHSRSAVAQITTAWPYFYHYQDVLTGKQTIVHSRVYRGVLDFDYDAFETITGLTKYQPAVKGPREALVLVYNDWDDGAMEHLAALESFVARHMDGHGADMFADVSWKTLNRQVAGLLVRRGQSRDELVQMRPDAFHRLMQRTYPANGSILMEDSEVASSVVFHAKSARARARKTHLLWLVGDNVDESGGTGTPEVDINEGRTGAPHVAEATQVFGALRLAAFPSVLTNHTTHLFSVLPTPQFILLGSGGLARSPRFSPSSSATVTPRDLQQFVLRHTTSSLFISTYEQAARLVEDYGRVAFLVLPEVLARVLRGRDYAEQHGQEAYQSLLVTLSQMPTVTALRAALPFFVMVPPAPSSPSASVCEPSWWSDVTNASTTPLDLGQIIAPLPAMEAVVSELHAAIALYNTTTTLSIIETPLRLYDEKRGQGSPKAALRSSWVRQSVVLPLVSPFSEEKVLRTFETLVGGLLVDTVMSLQSSQSAVAIDGSNFQDELAKLRGEKYVRPLQTVSDVVVVFDHLVSTDENDMESFGSSVAQSCSGTVRAHLLSHGRLAEEHHTKFMIANANDHDFIGELLRAAWPLPPSGVNSTGAVVCPSILSGGALAASGLDLSRCEVLCIPGTDKNLYRLQQPLRAGHDAIRQSDEDERPLEHPSLAQLRRAALDLAASANRAAEEGIHAEAAASEMHTKWETTEQTGVRWRLTLPASILAPMVEFELPLSPYLPDKDNIHFILLTDGSCALCANPTKAFRLLKGCVGSAPIRFHELDVTEFLNLPAAAQARLVYGGDTRAEMPFSLLGPRFFVGAQAAALLRPPRFVAQRGSRVFLTLNTFAYYDRASWPRAVLDLATAPFFGEVNGTSLGRDSIFQCVDDTIAATLKRKEPLRRNALLSEHV